MSIFHAVFARRHDVEEKAPTPEMGRFPVHLSNRFLLIDSRKSFKYSTATAIRKIHEPETEGTVLLYQRANFHYGGFFRSSADFCSGMSVTSLSSEYSAMRAMLGPAWIANGRGE